MKKIETKKDYKAALERFEHIFQAKDGSPESDEANVMALLIQDYESRHFIIEIHDPIKLPPF